MRVAHDVFSAVTRGRAMTLSESKPCLERSQPPSSYRLSRRLSSICTQVQQHAFACTCICMIFTNAMYTFARLRCVCFTSSRLVIWRCVWEAVYASAVYAF